MTLHNGRLEPRDWQMAGLLTLIAGALRVVSVTTLPRIVWGDEPFYLWLGRNWLTGHGYTFTGYNDVHHTPLYPLASGLLYLVTGNLELASNILFVLFGALLVIPIYAIARMIYTTRVAAIAGILIAVWPMLTMSILYWGTMTEPLYYTLVYAGIATGLVVLQKDTARAAALTGILFALAYLTRPEAIGYVVAWLGAFIIIRTFQRRLLYALFPIGAFVLGFALLFLPYAAYVREHTGEWMVTEKAGVTYVTSNSLAYGDTATFDRATWGLDSTGEEVFFFSRESYNVSMLQVITQDIPAFARLVYNNIRRFANSLLSPRLFPYLLVPIVALGWLRHPWSSRRLAQEFYLLLLISPVLGFIIFFIQDRYIAAIVPGLLIWAAHGLDALGDWLVQTGEHLRAGSPLPIPLRRALAALPLGLVLLYMAATVPETYQANQVGSFRPEHKGIGLWMRMNLPPGGIVMARYPAIAFYAEKRWVPTPNAPWPDVVCYARHKGVTYFVLDERETVKLRPQFAALLDDTQVPKELRVVHIDTSSSEKLIVYALREGQP